MSLSLLRNPSVVNNNLESCFRKRRGLHFRKTLGVYNFKVKPQQYYKNPHAVDLRLKENFLKKGDIGQREIRAVKNLSIRPFGEFTSKGKFIHDFSRVPNYNIHHTDFTKV